MITPLTIAVALLVAVSGVNGKNKTKTKKAPTKVVRQAPKAKSSSVAVRPRDPYIGAISADAATGRVLFEDNANQIAYPASVTKLMTALLVLEDVKRSKYSLSTKVTATADVNRSEPSCVGLKPGQSMTVNDLMMSLMVKSANDAAIALAVNSAGSLEKFVEKMNERAAKLGMINTRYFNPNGLPAPKYAKEFNRSTAADQLKLARELLKHKEILRYSSAENAMITDGDGKSLSLRNHNRLMRVGKFLLMNPDGTKAVDGLKTGYTQLSGSSIVLTGTRRGKRAIVVVLGSSNSDIREANAGRLLSDALGVVSW